jgi:hypothetical protein
MNPICLLTKGRTFQDMATRADAYKLLARNALPKYTAGKHLQSRPSHAIPEPVQKSLFEPATAAVKADAVEAPKIITPPVVPEIPVVIVMPVEPAKTPQPAVSKSPFSPSAKTSKKACAPGTWKQTTSFCKGLVQQFVFGRKRRPVHEATIQAELALEKVTVLRNDLNEDDLEVVLVERTVGTGEKPLARLSKMEMGTEAWNRFTAPFRKKNGENADNPKAGTKPSPELVAGA